METVIDTFRDHSGDTCYSTLIQGYDNADPARKNKCAAIIKTTLTNLMAIVMEEEADEN